MRFSILFLTLSLLVGCSNTHETSNSQEEANDSLPAMEEVMVHHDQAKLRTLVWESEGTPVIMFAGLGRPAEDLQQLGNSLQQSGYKAIAMEMRGAGKSTGIRPGLIPRNYIEDVNAVIDSLANDAPVFLLGWSEGNRIMRFYTTVYPNKTKAIILFAPVGEKIYPTDIHLHSAMMKVFDENLPGNERSHAVARSYFASGPHYVSAWDSGWSYPAAKAYLQACETKEAWIHDYEVGGVKPMLIVSGSEDRISPPQSVYDFAAKREPAPKVVILPRTAHALILEEPQICADTLIAFLKSIP